MVCLRWILLPDPSELDEEPDSLGMLKMRWKNAFFGPECADWGEWPDFVVDVAV